MILVLIPCKLFLLKESSQDKIQNINYKINNCNTEKLNEDLDEYFKEAFSFMKEIKCELDKSLKKHENKKIKLGNFCSNNRFFSFN